MLNHLYVVVDVFGDLANIHRGSLILWIWRGWYYTVQTINIETGKVKPLANIVWLKKLSREEMNCIDEGKKVSECLDRDEILRIASDHLQKARKVFSHLTEKDLEEIINRIEKAFKG